MVKLSISWTSDYMSSEAIHDLFNSSPLTAKKDRKYKGMDSQKKCEEKWKDSFSKNSIS